MLILFLWAVIIIAFITSSKWTMHIAEYDGTFYIRRFSNVAGFEYLQIPHTPSYTTVTSAPYWWSGRTYSSVSTFESVEEAEAGFKLYKEYRRPKIKMVKLLK